MNSYWCQQDGTSVLHWGRKNMATTWRRIFFDHLGDMLVNQVHFNNSGCLLKAMTQHLR